MTKPKAAALVSALAGTLILLVPSAAVAATLHQTNNGSCNTQYTPGGQLASPRGDFTTTFTWSAGNNGIRTNSGGSDRDLGSAGTLCNTQGGNAVTYKIRVVSSFLLEADVSCAGGGLGIVVPSVLKISGSSSCGNVTATLTSTCTGTYIQNCSVPIGALSFSTSGDFRRFGRSVKVTLWKSASSTNPYSFSTHTCYRAPGQIAQTCV